MADSSFPSRRSSTASRRSLQRRSSRLSQSDNLIDIFSDDNAANFMPVADGFRPSSGAFVMPTGSSSPPRPSTPQFPPRAASPPRASEYLKKRIAGQERPSSIHRSSLSGPQNDSFISRAPSLSGASEATARPLSVVSALSVPTSESSYIPSAGSSHAYASYPQVSTLNRHASTSTIQTQNRPYSGPSRPTHPYAMYPQIPGHQDAEQGDPFADPADIANVGFPGLQQNYARIRAADDEGADDLIGPDGHTEQLPPYSQFPTDIPAKARRELPESSRPLLAAETRISSDEPLSDPSSASSLLDNDDGTRINVAAARQAGDDDRSRTQRLKEKGQRRTCWGRVPVWVWIVIVVILCIIAAALGAAIGTFFAKKHPPSGGESQSTASPTSPQWQKHPPANDVTVWQTVTTTLIDAAPLTTTPTGIPTLTSGSFYGVPLPTANTTVDTCMEQPNGSFSWKCSHKAMLNLSIDYPDDYDCPIIHLTAEYPPNAPLRYGAQAPSMMGPAKATLMQDIQDNFSPAYFFQQLVDKLVIVKHEDIADQLSNWKQAQDHHRRSSEGSWASWFSERVADSADFNDDVESYLEEQDSIPLDLTYNELAARGASSDQSPVLTGDNLWFCFWNSTILEGFIYVTLPNQDTQAQNAAIASAVASSMYSEHEWTAAPSATPTGSPIMRRDQATPAPTTAQSGSSFPHFAPPSLPWDVKIEERRGAPNMPRPYCQKMYADHSGQISRVPDKADGLNFFNITEKQPVAQSKIGSSNSRRSLHSRQQQEDGSCKCIWRPN